MVAATSRYRGKPRPRTDSAPSEQGGYDGLQPSRLNPCEETSGSMTLQVKSLHGGIGQSPHLRLPKTAYGGMQQL